METTIMVDDQIIIHHFNGMVQKGGDVETSFTHSSSDNVSTECADSLENLQSK